MKRLAPGLPGVADDECAAGALPVMQVQEWMSSCAELAKWLLQA
jgi:hypothetical protein